MSKLLGWMTMILLSICVGVPEALAQSSVSHSEEAAALSIVAKAKADAGEFALAADMYEAAYRMDPTVGGYLYSAGRCAHKGGLWAKAVENYKHYRQVTPPADPAYAKAGEYLAETELQLAKVDKIKAEEQAKVDAEKAAAANAAAVSAAERARAADAAKKAAEVKIPTLQRLAPATWKKPTAMGAIGVGVVALGLGGYFAASGIGEIGDLQAKLDQRDPNGKVTGIERDAAMTAQSDGNRHKLVGATLIGTGAILAGIGTWLYFSVEDVKVAVAPNQLLVTVQF